MNKEHTASTIKEHADFVRREALSLRHVSDLAEAERPDAMHRLVAASVALPTWLGSVHQEVDRAPAVNLAALWRMLNRAGLEDERSHVQAAGIDLAGLQDLDPADARTAYFTTLADATRAGVLACVRSAESRLLKVKDARTEAERRALVLDAVHELTRPKAQGDAPLEEAWTAHLDRLGSHKAGPTDVLRLDSKRGAWAVWMNDMLGLRRGLEPGETLILSGGPESGKTSLAALFAVDALASECPVLFWQLELSREEILEHMQAQVPEPADWWMEPFWTRARRPLPEAWTDLLTVPRWPSPEVEMLLEAVENMALQAERRGSHACKGLVVIDYAQLLTLADTGPLNSQHRILATIVSRITKAAAEHGACVLLLSQHDKADADLNRMAHRVAVLQKANAKGKACSPGEPADEIAKKGQARLLTWEKARGVHYTLYGNEWHRPDLSRIIWNGGPSRAFHGGVP